MFPTSKSLEIAARSMRVELDWLQIRNPLRGNSALWNSSRHSASFTASLAKADGFIVLPGIADDISTEISELGQRQRVPGIFWRTDFALEPIRGLMAYGANRLEQSRRAAYFVDKILKGAKPGDLPVEQPKSFELVVNLKTAREIGVIVPPRVLAWADRIVK
jgi:putative ABC transport system substrate-binding protein